MSDKKEKKFITDLSIEEFKNLLKETIKDENPTIDVHISFAVDFQQYNFNVYNEYFKMNKKSTIGDLFEHIITNSQYLKNVIDITKFNTVNYKIVNVQDVSFKSTVSEVNKKLLSVNTPLSV